MSLIEQRLKDLPMDPGVYIMKSKEGQILYVGKARHLKNRVSQYFGNNSNRTEKVLKLVSKVYDFEYIITRNEVEALVLENNLIKQHKPPYNILLKDDKNYPFIKINVKKPFPKVEVVRRLKVDGAKYYGPYMIGVSSKDILDLIYSAFPLRTCNLDMKHIPKNHRPCLNYHIKKCLAPCIGNITEEEYMQIISKVIDFLNGNDKEVEEILKSKMQAASDAEDFELAILYKKKLETLDKLIRKQVTALPKDFNLDIFAIATNGLNTVVDVLFVRGGKLLGSDKQIINDLSLTPEQALSNYIISFYDNIKYIPDEIVTAIPLEDADVISQYLTEKKGTKVNTINPHQGARKQLVDIAQNNANDYLEKSLTQKERKDNLTVGGVLQLQEYLHLKKIPIRMECYDISHIQGTDKVASMVVTINGEAAKSQYRKFKIKTVEGNNDFASLKETLLRRLTKFDDKDESFSAVPDLLVIDGGKGQLSSVKEIMDEIGCNIEVISLAKREEEVFVPGRSEPYVLPRNSYALKLLQRIRDEAHRFAITFHRSQRLKRQTKSELDEIKGLGPKKKEILRDAFKTIDDIKNASIEELNLVKGIDKTTARNVYEHFHVD
ncbi:MAG: excinuclease ABC subunit UvrC [Clostridiales bacterium]|nr:excinuclease ABC subunit UvrC [Clostridiales bacterium]